MAAEDFFDERTEQSAIKATIVSKYFLPWSTLVSKHAKKHGEIVQYLDLCAGPGHYEDGSPSTPILILQKAIETRNLHDVLVTRFNDKSRRRSQNLREAIEGLPGVELLKYPPQVDNFRVNEELAKDFEQQLKGKRLLPTLSFVDPFGYSALSLQLIHILTRDWGCDCIVFLNYNRINPAIANPTVRPRMDSLFGRSRAEALRERVAGMSPHQREATILAEFKTAVEVDGRRLCWFSFKTVSGARTSHYIILVTKAPTGIKIMKEIMAKESSWAPDGLPRFEHNPARDLERNRPRQLGLLTPSQPSPLCELRQGLLSYFAGRTLTRQQIYEEYDRIDQRFIAAAYRDLLLQLEVEGAIVVDPPADQRQLRHGQRTMAESVKISFPPRSN